MPSLATIETACSSSTQLRRIAGWKPMFPWPVQCFALALVLVLLLPGAWRVLRPDRIKTQSPVQADPVQAWQNAIEKSAQGRYVHAARGSRLQHGRASCRERVCQYV